VENTSEQAVPGEQSSSTENTPNLTEQVPLDEASDADIDAFLENALSGETQEAEQQAQPSETQGDGENSGPAEQQTQTDGQAQSEDKPQDYWQQKSQKLETELAERDKRLEQQERYIQQRGTEIGQLRQENKRLSQQLDEQIEDETDPGQLVKLHREKEKLNEEDQKLEKEAQYMEQIHNAQKQVAQHLRPEEQNFGAMVAVLERDGIPPQKIQQFKTNPYAVASPDALIQLGKRAHAEQVLTQTIDLLKQVHAENKKLKEKPKQVAQNIQQALNRPPSINGAGGTAQQSGSISLPNDLDELGDAELEEAAKRLGLS
jgi:myosin heavy subunit